MQAGGGRGHGTQGRLPKEDEEGEDDPVQDDDEANHAGAEEAAFERSIGAVVIPDYTVEALEMGGSWACAVQGALR